VPVLIVTAETLPPRLIWSWDIYLYKSLWDQRSRVRMVCTRSYTIAESVFQRGAHCNAQFRSNGICEIWLDVCRFSPFWKTPPEKVENRSQVFGFGFENFFLVITLLDGIISALDEMSSNLNGMLRKAVRACTHHWSVIRICRNLQAHGGDRHRSSRLSTYGHFSISAVPRFMRNGPPCRHDFNIGMIQW
jgi:hypothetical protein